MFRKLVVSLGIVLGVLALSLLLVQRPANAQASTVTLQDALAHKLVNVTLTGTDDVFFRQSAAYRIQNLTAGDLSVVIRAGQLLTPTDTSYQQLLVAEDVTTTIKANQVATGSLWAYCTQLSKHAPDKSVAFAVGQMASGNLGKVSQVLNRRKIEGDLGAQLAVWRITDNATLEEITGGQSGSDLISAIQPLLGLAGDPFTKAESILQEAGTGLHYSEFGTPTPIQSPLPGNTNVNDILSFLRNITSCCTCFGAFGGLFFFIFLRR
jgi:hypothetical protein